MKDGVCVYIFILIYICTYMNNLTAYVNRMFTPGPFSGGIEFNVF